MKSNKYKLLIALGQQVKLITDKDQLTRMCTGITIRSNGICYELTQGSSATWHYDFEIEFTENKTIIGFNR